MVVAVPAPSTRETGYAGPGTVGGWWSQLDDETAPELRWPLSVHVFSRMERTDSQAASVMRAVTLPIRRTQWSIQQAGASDEVTQFVAAELGLPVDGADAVPAARTRDRFSWPDHLRQALRMLVHGHMFFEQVYRIGDDGRAHLRKLAPRLPQTITAVNVASDGGLVSIEQAAPLGAGSARSVVIPVSRLVAYTHDREGGNWLGRSLYRTAYKNWLLKDRVLRVWTQSIDRNGMGLPWYTASESNDDLDTGIGLATKARSGDNSGGGGPNGSKLELLGVQGTLPDAEAAVRYHDEAIGRSVLAHFLNLNAQGGSYALAAIQSDTFVQSLEGTAQEIGDVVNAHVIEDLVDVNFGPEEPAPRLVHQEIGSRHAITAEAIRALVDSGVLQSEPALQRYVRETYGIPESEPLPGQPPTTQEDPS